MPSPEALVKRYHKQLESSALGAVKVLGSGTKDPAPKLRDKFKAVDDAVRNLKKAARDAAREKRDRVGVPTKRRRPAPKKKPEQSPASSGFGEFDKGQMQDADFHPIPQQSIVPRAVFERLSEKGIACVSVNIGIRADTGKKTSAFVSSWRSVRPETCLAYYDPSYNSVAVLTGAVSGIFVLDVDNNESTASRLNGVEAWDLMTFRNGDIHTWTARTGNGGLHVYFKYPASGTLKNLRNRVSILYDGSHRGIDVRADGGVAFCPPSAYDGVDGTKTYAWLTDPDSCEIADIPSWLVEVLEDDDAGSRRTFSAPDAQARDGFSEALAIRDITRILRGHPIHPDLDSEFRSKVSDRGDLYAFRVRGPRVCLHGHSHRGSNNFSVRRVVRDLYYICHGSECSRLPKKHMGRLSLEAWLEGSPSHGVSYKDPVFASLNDASVLEPAFAHDCNHRAMSRMLSEVYKRCGRVVSCNDEFYTWSGHLWKKTSVSAMRGLVAEHLDLLGRSLLKTIPRDTDEKATKALLKRIDKTGSSQFVDGCLKLLMPYVTQDDFCESLDSNRDILAVKNGIVDLRTGRFWAHHPRFLCTFSTDADYRENVTSTVFRDFLDSVFNGNRDLVDYLQLLFGYALTGHTSEQMFVILYGLGSNGKSVLINALKGCLGRYFSQMHREVIICGPRASRGAADPHMASLENSRYAVCEETGQDNKLDDVIIKNIAGETEIVTRNMYEKTRSFAPTFQAFLATNHKPAINVADPALLRRLVLIPFMNVYVPENKYDPDNFPSHRHLDTSLNQKLGSPETKSEILCWLVQGAARWYEAREASVDGHGTERPVLRSKPRELDAALEEYYAEQDPVKTFVETYCEAGHGHFASSSELLFRYRECMADDLMTAKSLSSGLKRLGFDNNGNKPVYLPQLKESVRGFRGLRVAQE